MKLGLSTYSFYWHISKVNPNPLSIEQLLERTKEFNIHLFQICDYEPFENIQNDQLKQIASKAQELGIELEVGTRGIQSTKLIKYLEICEALNSKTLRTMINSSDHIPRFDEAIFLLKQLAPTLEKRGITIALETYEQRKTEELVSIVKEVGSENIGICLDPANCIANLEQPNDVIDLTGPYVKNLHLKDFKFDRKKGWVGFSLIGTPFGEGKLDHNYMFRKLKENEITVNAIIEFWLPFTNSIEETLNLEEQWIETSIRNFKNYMEELR